MLDAFDGAELLDEGFETRGVFEHHHQIATKQTVVAVDINAAQNQFLVFRDDAGEIVDNTDIVVTNHTQRNAILRRALAAPLGLDNAIAKTATQLRGIRTIAAVNLDTAIDGDEAKDIVALDGRTALGQLRIAALQVAIDNQDIVVDGLIKACYLRLVELEFGSRTGLIISCNNTL